jgi:hypothetical protein
MQTATKDLNLGNTKIGKSSPDVVFYLTVDGFLSNQQ